MEEEEEVEDSSRHGMMGMEIREDMVQERRIRRSLSRKKEILTPTTLTSSRTMRKIPTLSINLRTNKVSSLRNKLQLTNRPLNRISSSMKLQTLTRPIRISMVTTRRIREGIRVRTRILIPSNRKWRRRILTLKTNLYKNNTLHKTSLTVNRTNLTTNKRTTMISNRKLRLEKRNLAITMIGGNPSRTLLKMPLRHEHLLQHLVQLITLHLNVLQSPTVGSKSERGNLVRVKLLLPVLLLNRPVVDPSTLLPRNNNTPPSHPLTTLHHPRPIPKRPLTIPTLLYPNKLAIERTQEPRTSQIDRDRRLLKPKHRFSHKP